MPKRSRILAANPRGVLKAQDEIAGWLANNGKYGGDDAPGGAEVVGVVALVGEHMVGRQALDQFGAAADIALLAGPAQEPHRIAQPVRRGVDLAQAASGAAQAT